MPSFPTMSKSANISGFTRIAAINPTKSSQFSSGHQLTRAIFTNVPYKWSFQYNLLTNADKELLVDFEKEVKYTTSAFDWVNPSDNITYSVRFTKVLSFNMERIENYWSVAIEVVERIPNSDASNVS